MLVSQPTLVTAPLLLPITLAEVKKHCEVPADDTAHDTQLTTLMSVARDQFEADCDLALLATVYSVNLDSWPVVIDLPIRPLATVNWVKYYDDAGTQQTLATSVYSVNSAQRRIELAYNQTWPSVQSRWDAIEIRFTCGYADAASVPASAKHALLLLIGYYFGQNRGDNDRAGDLAAYRRIAQQFLRSTYP